MTTDPDDVIGWIADIFERRGAESYLGEAITMAEHMLQSAALAQAEGASEALVAAALLHDIGYYTGALAEDPLEDVVDNRHDLVGADALEACFPQMVTECVRLHVAAKRYLCATDRTYYARLSQASQHSLSFQGGPMSEAEQADFRRFRFHREALRVRRWDDDAKAVGLKVGGFEDFRALLQRVISSARVTPPRRHGREPIVPR